MCNFQIQTSSQTQLSSKRASPDQVENDAKIAKRVARATGPARNSSHPEVRGNSEFRRETTPPSRHMARIMAKIAGNDENVRQSHNLVTTTKPAAMSESSSSTADEIADSRSESVEVRSESTAINQIRTEVSVLGSETFQIQNSPQEGGRSRPGRTSNGFSVEVRSCIP